MIVIITATHSAITAIHTILVIKTRFFALVYAALLASLSIKEPSLIHYNI